MTVRRITAVTAPRDFRLKPENIRAGLLELQAIQASIIEQWNSSAFPVLNSLRGEALSSGLDGGTILIDARSKPEEQGGLFWNALRERPNTVKEQCRTLGMDVAAMRRVLDLKQDKVSASSSSDTDLTTIKKWIKQIAADTIFSNKSQGTEYTENLFTGSATQTNAWSLLDLVDGILAAMGGGLVRDATSYTFSGRNYLNAATTIHGGLLALDTSLKTVDDKWTVSGANLYRAAGSVGIGTASPSEPLHIVSAGNGGVEIENTSGAPSLIFDMPQNEEARILFKENSELRASIIWDSQAPDTNALIFKGKGTNAEMARFTPEGRLKVAANVEAEDNGKSLTLDVEGLNSANAGLWSSGSHLVLGSKTTNDLNIFLNDAETLQITRGTSPVSRVSYTSHGGSGVHHFAGNVGVGTNNPSTTLDVAGDVNLSGDLSFDGSSTVASSIINENNFASASATALASSASIKAYVDALKLDWKAGTGGPQSTADNEILLVLGGDGVTTTGSSDTISIATDVAQAHVTSVGTLTSLNVAGNVGVGTTSPAKTLEVKAGSSGNGINLISHDNATAVVQLESGSAGGYVQVHDSSNNQKVRLSSAGSSWFSGGSLGIGNEAPAKTLDVTGDLKVSGTITLGGVEYTPPESDGNAGQVMKTDGSGNWDWVDNSGGGSTTFEGNTDTNFTSLAAADLPIYNGSSWENAGLTGDATLSSSGVFTIANDAINAAKIAANAVGSSEIADNAVSKAKMQDDSVGKAEVKSDENLAFAGHIIVAYAGTSTITEKSAVKAAGYDASTGRVKVELCSSTGKAMGIALEAASSVGDSIEVMIAGVTTARVFPNGNTMSLEAELSPRNDGSGQVVQALGPNVGQVIGYLLEEVLTADKDASSLDRKIWVQPC